MPPAARTARIVRAELGADESLVLTLATGTVARRRPARLRSAAARGPQFLPAADGDLNAYRGMITERHFQTDCFQPKGIYLTLSHAWSGGVLLLACEQTLGQQV